MVDKTQTQENKMTNNQPKGNKMTSEQVIHNGITYIIPQHVIDDLKTLHGVDAVEEVKEMLQREEDQ